MQENEKEKIELTILMPCLNEAETLETCIKKAKKSLEKNNIRDKIHIATKLPQYLIKSKEGIEKIFQEELKRLRTDHIDYYFMHMLTDVKSWERLKELGVLIEIKEDKIEMEYLPRKIKQRLCKRQREKRMQRRN